MPSISPAEFDQLLAAPLPQLVDAESAPAEAPAEAAALNTDLKLGRFTDAWQFAQTFFPETEPYRWQMETLMQLSGYPDPYNLDLRVQFTSSNPLLYSLCAANGSGKDKIVLAAWAVFFICTKRKAHWIGTSASFTQLDEQTWRHIKTNAEEVNKVCGKDFLVIRKHKILCTDTGSEITLYRTDESGKTEGWHPLTDGGEMAIVLNESKSLEEEIVMSFKRCHGYTHWINISSPGLKQQGYFFKRYSRRDVEWPSPVVPGREYFRQITWRDCPHLADEYKRDVAEFGARSAYILSSYEAQYPPSSSDLHVVPPDSLHYNPPEPNFTCAPRRAGVDFSGGGDAQIISIWEGNAFDRQIDLHEPHAPTLARRVVALLREHNVEANFALGDAGHLGNAVMQHCAELGYPMHGVYNNSRARNNKVYLNRGAELAFNFRQLILNKALNLRAAPPLLLRECGDRLYELTDNNKIKLEDKKKHRGRHGQSPDNFDAAVLANAFVHHSQFKNATSPPKAAKPALDIDTLWTKIYGNVDQQRASAGAYRTSGIYSGRRIGSPLSGARPRFR